jgi:hypothetical protein
MMRLSLTIVGASLPRPASAGEVNARNIELCNALKTAGDHIAATGAREGKIQNNNFSGSFFIEG